MDACIYRTSCIQLCNKSYYGPHNINAIHKGDRCMWNMIIVYIVLAYMCSVNESFMRYDNGE